MSFIVGQRWISESESSLGLGIVVESNARMVSLFFPAAQENRAYAAEGAPIIRVVFREGDVVESHQGWKLRVSALKEKNNLIVYVGERLDSQEMVELLETHLSHNLTFSKPQDRLFNGQLDRNSHYVMRYQALNHQQAQFLSPLRGLRGVRASLIPHQLHIATEIGHRIAPRVLLADEVGLGKTIEAGMILHQQLMTGRIERVLILVPETLQHQWLVEMLRRFNLQFALMNESRCQKDSIGEDHDDEEIENPFDNESLVIASLDWLTKNPQRQEMLLASDWDMLVVDEAHHLEWSEEEVSPAYQLVESLAQQIASVLLLTATPEQLGLESHFARLRLLDADRFYDFAEFTKEQRNFQPVAESVNQLLSQQPLSDAQQTKISELLSEQDVEPLLKVVNDESIDVELRQQTSQELINNLIDRHGTSRLLFRNTRQGVKGFPKRTLQQITFEYPKQYVNSENVLEMVGEKLSVESLFYPEIMFQQLNSAAAWWEFDPRVVWLINLLKSDRKQKILLICHSANTVVQLEKVLREQAGIRAAMFHENMSIIERDKAAAYFAQHEDGAQILLSSAIGGEGRNFQFASTLILFSLPHLPDQLEQCIGRLDRIGQQKDITIYAPTFQNLPQHRLAQWYHDGLNAFEETCPMGSAIYNEFQEELRTFIFAREEFDLEAFQKFIDRSALRSRQLRQELEQGRDRLLELNSNGGENAQQLANAISEQDASPDLTKFSQQLFDIIGFEQQDLDYHTLLLEPTGHMLFADFPGVKEEGSAFTFNREQALSREDIEFLSWDHPILRNGIDLILSSDIGRCSIATLRHKGLPTGTLLVELIYVIEAQGPASLQLNRFLPPTPIRLLIDAQGNNLGEQVAFDVLQNQLRSFPRGQANKAIAMVRGEIERRIEFGDSLIGKSAKEVIEQAITQADSVLSAEHQRLTALQAVNKSIRQDEVDALEALQSEALTQLSQANWRLDSLRVIVSTQK